MARPNPPSETDNLRTHLTGKHHHLLEARAQELTHRDLAILHCKEHVVTELPHTHHINSPLLRIPPLPDNHHPA